MDIVTKQKKKNIVNLKIMHSHIGAAIETFASKYNTYSEEYAPKYAKHRTIESELKGIQNMLVARRNGLADWDALNLERIHPGVRARKQEQVSEAETMLVTAREMKTTVDRFVVDHPYAVSEAIIYLLRDAISHLVGVADMPTNIRMQFSTELAGCKMQTFVIPDWHERITALRSTYDRSLLRSTTNEVIGTAIETFIDDYRIFEEGYAPNYEKHLTFESELKRIQSSLAAQNKGLAEYNSMGLEIAGARQLKQANITKIETLLAASRERKKTVDAFVSEHPYAAAEAKLYASRDMISQLVSAAANVCADTQMMLTTDLAQCKIDTRTFEIPRWRDVKNNLRRHVPKFI